jgi:polar amino acid transport system substrate-binding protein
MLAVAHPGKTTAQVCGTDYALKDGETLALVAARVYGNPNQWSIIFYANQDRLGSNASLIVPGLQLRLPCIGRPLTQAEPQQPPKILPAASAPPEAAATGQPSFIISSMLKRLQFLTADGFSPFTARSLDGGGMLTQVVSAAMDLIKNEAKERFDYNISWVNDWSAHLNPLLRSRAFDVGFPWSRPDCDGGSKLERNSALRCEQFFFSDPLYEVVTSLFVRSDSSIRGLRNEEIAGKTLCRAAGFSTHELDQGGRNWLKDGRVTLIRAPTIDECFRMLAAGTVDVVVEAELAGRTSLVTLGIAGKVRIVDHPVALTTFHVLVSKSHPHARTILYYLNSSLGKLRESGEYDRIIEQHLARFWASQTGAPGPAAGEVPAALPKTGASGAKAESLSSKVRP